MTAASHATRALKGLRELKFTQVQVGDDNGSWSGLLMTQSLDKRLFRPRLTRPQHRLGPGSRGARACC